MLSCVDLSPPLDKTRVPEQSAYWIYPLWTIISSLIISSWLMSQSSVTPSHNLLTIMCLTLYLFTRTFTLKENPCNYTLVLFIH